MLRVLTLATLFPNRERPTFGVFVERQTVALSRQAGVEVRVVAPVGVAPWPLSLHSHYRWARRLARREGWEGLEIHRPRFPVWPRIGAARAGRDLAHALLPQLREIRRDFPFDVIDAEFFWPDGVAAMRLADALDVPFSIKARGSDIDHWSGIEKIGPQLIEAATRAGGLLAVSEALRQRMIDLGMPQSIQVHYTGIDLDRFKPVDRQAAKAAIGVAGPLAVTVGALIPIKGQSLVIDALDHIPDARLLIVGDGPERTALERQAARFGNRISFLGNRPHDSLPALLAAADVMVLPSQREGLANVWVEALACGTPIVISEAGGAREVVDAPSAGRIAARTPEAIARAIKELLADPQDPWQVRRSAERFSWERNANELELHLRQVSGQRH